MAKRFAARSAAAEAESEAKEVGEFSRIGSIDTLFAKDAEVWLVIVTYAAGTAEDIDKLARRQVKPTRQHNEECRKLLGLMGIPFLIVSVLSPRQVSSDSQVYIDEPILIVGSW